jgi:MFS superfamily sulfate permease-like transporter
VLLFLTKPLGYLPTAVLSAIVFMIGLKLIDVKGMAELFRVQRDEFVVALITACVVVFVDVMHGIIAAVILSIIDNTRHSYRLRTRVLTRNETGHWMPHEVAANLLAAPGIIVYRFEADLFYANAGRFMDEILKLVEQTQPTPRWIVVDASQISNVDYTAGKTLLQLREELTRRGIGIASVAVPEGVSGELERYRLLGNVTDRRPIYPTVEAAVDALRDASPPDPAHLTASP